MQAIRGQFLCLDAAEAYRRSFQLKTEERVNPGFWRTSALPTPLKMDLTLNRWTVKAWAKYIDEKTGFNPMDERGTK